MSKQEQSVRKHNAEAGQPEARKGSKRMIYISTAIGIAALILVLWWIV
ncbi:MAG: hypothetical protein ACLFWF_04665 [Alphaproteobacteria bacterium]